MTLRKKTLLIIGLTLVCLIGVLYATLSTVLLKGFAELEDQNVQQNVEQVQDAFSDELTKLHFTVRDWAEWDDTYTFIQDGNETYLKTNLNEATIARLNLNLILYVQPSGRVVFGQGFDLENHHTTLIPDQIQQQLTEDSLLLQNSPTDKGLTGLLLLPENAILIASQPILTGVGQGPVRGTLVFGRYLDTGIIQSISERTHLSLTVYRLDNPQLTADLQLARASLTEQNSVFVRSLNQNTIAGYTLLRDVYDQPALLVEIQAPRGIHRQGQITQRYLLLSLVIVGLVFGWVTLLLLEKLVLARLAWLSQGVKNIGVTGDLSVRIPTHGSDELSRLAGTINWMLDTLTDSQRQQQKSEEQYRRVVEQTSEGIFLIDPVSGRILEANIALQRLLGYAAAEITQLTLYDVVAHDHESIDRNVQQILQVGHHTIGEQQYRRRDNSLVDVEVSVDLISHSDRTVLCAIVHNITQRKQAEEEVRLLQITTHAIGEALDFHSALEVALQKICEATGWNYGEAWVPSADGTVLECSPASYLSDRPWFKKHPHPYPLTPLETFRRASENLIFPYNARLPGRIWASQQPEWVKDVSLEPDAIFVRSQLAKTAGLKAGLGVPILSDGQVLAVLVFFMVRSCEEDKRLMELVSAVAMQLGSIIQRKQAEESLRQAEERYRGIFENAVEGIFQTTPNGIYVSANPALARIYGYETPAGLIAGITNIENQLYVDPKQRTNFTNLLQRNDDVSGFESQVYRKDGSIIWISENARSVRDSNGTLLYYEGTVEDITHRKQAEEALRRSEAKNRALLSAIPDLIIRLTKDGTYLDAIPARGVDTLADPIDMIGKKIYDALPLQVAQHWMQYVERALATGESQIFEYELPGDASTCEYEARVVVSGGDEVLIIVRDITERKKVEQMKNEFVSVVSHELRTPLTSIRGSLGLLTGGVAGDLPDQAKALVDIAYKNSQRLILLINDILDIEKIESGKMDFNIQPIELMPLVEQVVEANRAYAEQFGVQFVVEQGSPDIKVNTDSDRLMQVMTNLLSNAAKFSPANSVVSIAVTRHNSMVRVSVIDRGFGIPEGFRNQIFQKFAQADASNTRQKGGTGLGLSISRAIIEKLDGQIGFTTETNVGTTFYFDLPEWQDELAPITVRSHLFPPTRVLICEDDRDIATLLSLMLQQGGLVADIAYNAAQAKQLLAQSAYAAITVDLALPGQDGISLIRELREQEKTRYLPIVVVSAKAQEGRQELQGGGFAVVDWLDKPINQDRLMSAVEQALQRTGSKPRILHVEDDPDVIQVVTVILQGIAEISSAANFQEAQQKLTQESFDLVILDLELPDNSGLELLSCLKSQSKAPISVVIFSAHEIGTDTLQEVAATLVKSRTSNQELLDTIRSLVGQAWSGNGYSTSCDALTSHSA